MRKGLIALLAICGIAAAAGIVLAANEFTGDSVGLSADPLEAGPQRMRVVVDANGATGGAGNFNYVRVSAASLPPPVGSTPFGGTAVPLAPSAN